MRSSSKSPLLYSNRILLLVIIFVIVIYFVLILVWLVPRNANRAQELQQRNMLMSLLVEYKHPDKNQTKLLFKMFNSDMKVSFDHYPQWPTQILSKDKLTHLLNETSFTESLEFSYRLEPNLWLNYQQNPQAPPYLDIMLFFLSALVVIAMVIFYFWIVSLLSMSLNYVVKTTEKLGVDINSPINYRFGPPIFDQTSAVLKKMQLRIKELMTHRAQMLSAISHDLGTPITRLRLKIHFIEDRNTAKKLKMI